MSTTRWVVVVGGWLSEVAVAVAVVGCCGVVGVGCCWGWLLGLGDGLFAGGWLGRKFASCVKRDVNRPRPLDPTPAPAAQQKMEADMDTATATILVALQDAGLSPQNAAARNQFVQQTSLVVRGIRAGYLVDAFPFPQRKLDSWFRALTARLPKADKDFAILHEDTSDSLFFVNRILLLDNLKSGFVPIWVNTDNSSIQVSWNMFLISMRRDPTL